MMWNQFSTSAGGRYSWGLQVILSGKLDDMTSVERIRHFYNSYGGRRHLIQPPSWILEVNPSTDHYTNTHTHTQTILALHKNVAA